MQCQQVLCDRSTDIMTEITTSCPEVIYGRGAWCLVLLSRFILRNCANYMERSKMVDASWLLSLPIVGRHLQ